MTFIFPAGWRLQSLAIEVRCLNWLGKRENTVSCDSLRLELTLCGSLNFKRNGGNYDRATADFQKVTFQLQNRDIAVQGMYCQEPAFLQNDNLKKKISNN